MEIIIITPNISLENRDSVTWHTTTHVIGPNSTNQTLLNSTNQTAWSVTSPSSLEYHPFFTHFNVTLRVMIALTLMIFGCVANIVSLLAMSHTRITHLPRGLLIIFIVIADNLYLTSVLVVEMSDSFTVSLKPGCPYLYFILHTFKLWSYMLVVLFLLDRVIAVKYSTWYQKRSSRFWTKFSICVSLAVSACTSVFILVFVLSDELPVPAEQISCVVLPNLHEPFVLYLGIALLGFGEVVTELVALVCTGWIIYSLVLWPEKIEKQEKQNGIEVTDIKAETAIDGNANKDKTEIQQDVEMNHINGESETSKEAEENDNEHTTATVCSLRYVPNYTVEASVVGAAMVILCVPQTISFMYFHVRSPSQLVSSQLWFPHALVFIQTMSLSFHGIKLILYLCSSKLFRESVHKICCACFR